MHNFENLTITPFWERVMQVGIRMFRVSARKPLGSIVVCVLSAVPKDSIWNKRSGRGFFLVFVIFLKTLQFLMDTKLHEIQLVRAALCRPCLTACHRPLLVQAECVRCLWLLAQTKVATIFGLVTLLDFTPQGIVIGF